MLENTPALYVKLPVRSFTFGVMTPLVSMPSCALTSYVCALAATGPMSSTAPSALKILLFIRVPSLSSTRAKLGHFRGRRPDARDPLLLRSTWCDTNRVRIDVDP